MHSLRTSPVFSLVVLAALGLFGFFGAVLLWPELVLGLLGQSTTGHISQHFRVPYHRVHDLTFAFLLGTAAVGLIPQLRSPSKNVAGQLMALVPFAGLLLAVALTNASVLQIPWVAIGAVTLVASTLHPTGRHPFGSFAVSRVSRVMLALVVVAAVPLLALAATNIGLQRSVADEHAALGHYGFMAAFGVTVVGVAFLASLRPDGWWLPAWVAGVLPALLGLISLLFPEGDSGLGPVWALAAIAWGVAFVAAAELTQEAKHPTLLGSRGARREPEPGDQPPFPAAGAAARRPASVYASAIIAIGLALLFAVMHLTGGGLGPGLHAPPSGGQGNTDGPGRPGAAETAARTVVIATLDTMAFEPSRVDVSAGETVTFVVTNTGRTVHEFTLGDAAAQQQRADEMARMGAGMAHGGANSITLQPGETKRLSWRFGDVATLEYGCHEPGHYQAGMHGQITVA
jgi:uncharacterized cupredoxin-like copper-binding protein